MPRATDAEALAPGEQTTCWSARSRAIASRRSIFGCSVSALQTQRSRRKRTSGDLRQDVTERLMFTTVNFRRGRQWPLVRA